MEQPHLILDWHFDCNTQILSCTLADGECVYIAHKGGIGGYTKTYKGEETTIAENDWSAEKLWISETYGETYGYYQPDETRVGEEGHRRQEGLGPNGEYLDHLQRIIIQLNGGQMAYIDEDNPLFDTNNEKPVPKFVTPDNGATIYKLLPTNDTFYNGNYNREAGDGVWAQVPQPCAMQPNSLGYVLSSYEEMALVGVSETIIDQCKAGEWPSPPAPEYLKNFTLPTENTHPLTLDNLHNIY